jgi:radical SAM superfamily enzyme YgiQ (UPF0313 family)
LNVACIYPPFGHHPFQENLAVVDEDFGRLPPLSLLYAAAVAERHGHRVIVVDANAHSLSLSEVVHRLREFRPDVLAFTLSTYAFDTATAWMDALRRQLKVPTVAGGVNVQLFPEATMAHPAVDYGVLHFGTAGFPALLDALEAGRDPAGLPEVVTRGADGTVCLGPVDRRTNPYLHLPAPARHLVDNRVYHSFISQRRNFTVMVTSTGCPFRCSFCAIPPRPRYLNPLDDVVREVRSCVTDHGIREIDFFDSDLFADRARGLELCRRLTALGTDLEWSCRTRVDRLDEELVRAARRSGCRKMYVGIETPSPAAQRALGKRVKLDCVPANLRMMRRLGVRPLGFFMLGVPGETHRTALRTIAYALGLPLDYAQFSRMIPKPGSEMHRELVERLGEDPWVAHLRGQQRLGRLPNLWSSIGEAAIERYTKLAYAAFYYRPTYVLRALARMRSLEELARSGRTALRMIAALAYHDAGAEPPLPGVAARATQRRRRDTTR